MKIREFSESISFERLAMAQAGGEVALPLQHWGRFLPAEFAHFWDLSIFSTFLELGRLTGFNELLLEFGSLAALWLSYFVDPILLWMNGKNHQNQELHHQKQGHFMENMAFLSQPFWKKTTLLSRPKSVRAPRTPRLAPWFPACCRGSWCDWWTSCWVRSPVWSRWRVVNKRWLDLGAQAPMGCPDSPGRIWV